MPNENLTHVLQLINDQTILTGFKAAQRSRNISILKRLAAGGDPIQLAQEINLSVRALTSLAKRFGNLAPVKARLFDHSTSVLLPEVWATTFKPAARYLRKTYCGHLELNTWQLELSRGDKQVVMDLKGF